MVTCMVLLQLRCPDTIQLSRAVSVLEETLDILDKFNRLAPGLERDDKEDLAWPGVWSMFTSWLLSFIASDAAIAQGYKHPTKCDSRKQSNSVIIFALLGRLLISISSILEIFGKIIMFTMSGPYIWKGMNSKCFSL